MVERPVGHQAVARLSHAQQREARESQNDSGKTLMVLALHQNEEHFSAERYNESATILKSCENINATCRRQRQETPTAVSSMRR